MDIKKSLVQTGKHAGEKNGMWKGGVAEYPNHFILKKRRLEILKRAKGKCEICGESAYEVHHIDFSKNNHSLDNLIYLCRNCHLALHMPEARPGRPAKILYKGMTAKEIRQKTGLSFATIYKFIRGEKLRVGNLDKINLVVGDGN